MRVGINALSIRHGVTGGGETYLHNLVGALLQENSDDAFVVFVQKGNREAFQFSSSNLDVVEYPAVGNGYLRVLYEQAILPAAIRRLKLDVLHCPANFCLLVPGIPTVLTIQTTPQLLAVPELLHSAPFTNFLTNKLMALSARRATLLTTVSQTAKNDVIERFKIPSEKVTYVYHGGADPRFRPETAKGKPLEQYGVHGPYILSVSGVYAFKNYCRLIEAFGILRREHNIPEQLVIIGRTFNRKYYQQMIELVERLQLETSFVHVDGLPHDQLPEVYSNAAAYVYPSLYESFGLTPIEAMASGVPVVCSSASVMPEICGGAAHYCDPYDPEDMAEKIAAVLSDRALRDGLVARGLVRASEFSWTKAAKETFAVYQHAIALAS